MSFRLFATVGFLVMVWPSPAAAQQAVKLEFTGGHVKLHANNAPVRAILAEWARLGGATIVNGERIAGPPMTLELSGVTERQALDVVLRGVAGYMLAPRRPGTQGVSAFDRIMILPTSVAPRNPPPQPQPGVGAARPVNSQPRVFRQPPSPLEAPADDPADLTEPDAADEGANTPRPGPGMRVAPPRPAPRPVQGGTTEPQIVVPDEDQQQPEPAPAGTEPTTANPFGVPFGSSPMPGVVTPAPQQRQQPAGRPQRP